MDNTATIDQTARNRMSVMAWGMTALCAWVILLASHSFDLYAKAAQYPATAHEPTSITAPNHP
jgi:hypothetical protein